jgi:hypothetical protein
MAGLDPATHVFHRPPGALFEMGTAGSSPAEGFSKQNGVESEARRRMAVRHAGDNRYHGTRAAIDSQVQIVALPADLPCIRAVRR